MTTVFSNIEMSRTVRETIERYVLPTVDDDWAASYLRSSIVVLTALEDRLAHGGEESLDASSVEPLVESLTAVAGVPEAIRDQLVVAARPGEGDEARRAATNALIGHAYSLPADSVDRAQLLAALAAFRDRVLDREAQIYGRAWQLPIF